jgi:3-oxoacyl-[acyl-carrier protein] reductase
MKKVALVTGASRGIGKHIAIELANDGFHVLINYFSNDVAAQNVLEEVKNNGGSAELLKFDVAILEETIKTLADWKNKNDNRIIEVLVNNAGIRKDNLFVWQEENDWNNVININLNSFYNVTRQLIQDMILNKWGRIVNIVSLSGIKGMAGQVNYSAAKGGLIAATKALAQEVGRKKITVNAVAPGFVKTNMTEDLDEASLKKMVPLNRFGEPQEVAHLVSFLVSEKAAYITGEVISINGGLYT